jgi:release factor glutamine methyltransferase
MLRSIQTILTQDQSALERALGLDSSTCRIEVQCLLQKTLGVARAYLFTYPERVLSPSEMATYKVLFQRRLGGEPIAYILGEREFFGLKFKVTPDTLIPRPETELLVELALERMPYTVPSFPLPRFPPLGKGAWLPSPNGGELAREPTEGGGAFRVLDLGTGTGAIALAIAHLRPNAHVWACDASASALAVARENARHLNLNNVHFVESDWFTAFQGQRFDFIISNPPYISVADKHLSEGDVRFEPISALASGKDGLDDIRRIIAQADAHLRNNSFLLIEHGYDQASKVRELFLCSGFTSVFSTKDLAGIERCSGGQLL